MQHANFFLGSVTAQMFTVNKSTFKCVCVLDKANPSSWSEMKERKTNHTPWMDCVLRISQRQNFCTQLKEK